MGRFQDFVTQNRLKRYLAERVTRERRRMRQVYGVEKALETASLDEIQAYQEGKLRGLLERASGAPYYRAILNGLGQAPSEFRLELLDRLPLLTKQILRREQDRLRVPGAEGAYENFSGGSTGIPIRFWQDDHFKVHLGVATRRANEFAGAFPGARVAKLWGAPQDRSRIEGWKGKARLWLLNMRYLDSFDMGAERMQAYHEAMETFQPDLIQAYASSIHLLARFLEARGLRPSYPRISIISSAEKLHPEARRKIEEVFRKPVFDRYGSREAPAMAAECACHDGLHVRMPAYLIETIDPGTGKALEERRGEIVVTALDNHAMPLIRYRIGDEGILTRTRCACGMSFVRLRQIAGRTTDNFLMADGRIVHGEYFTHLFYGREGIEQFQFVQEDPRRFTLHIVPGPGYSPLVMESIERQAREVIGRESELRLEIRPRIPKTPSGKHRFTISHVSLDQLATAVAEGECRPA